MSIKTANDLASQGKLLEAEDIYWQEIESGNVEARLYLAYSFHDAGLISLALDNYLELKGTEYWQSAGTQASQIMLDVHKYKEAKEFLKGIPSEETGLSLDAIKSAEEKLSGYLKDIPEIVEQQLLAEQQLLQALSAEPNLELQLELMQLRKYLAHYSTVLATEIGAAVSKQAIEVQVANGMNVSRSLAIALGNPARRWFEAAHAAVNAFTLLQELNPNAGNDFQALTQKAMEFIEKKYVLAGREISEDDEDFAVNNLIWGLNNINSPAKDFYSHLIS